MNRCKDILTHHTLVEHDGILIVVTLPRHVSHEQVTTECQLAVLCSITLCQDIASLYALTLVTDRTKVNHHVLVGTTELRNAVFLQGGLEAYELLILGTVV